MKHNKLFLLVIALLLGVMVLSACGGSAEEAAESPAQEAEEPMEEPTEEPMEEPTEEPMEEPTEEPMEEPTEEPMEEPTEEPMEEAAAETFATLVIWADDKRIPVLETLVDEFAASAGVEVILEQVQLQDMLEQTRVAIPAGEGPDIFITAHDQIGQYVEGGLISPIDLGGKSDNIAANALEAFNYNSELYALPYATENVGLIRNVDLVPEPVTTWDEMLEVTKALIDDGTIESTTVFPSDYAMIGLHNAFGGYLFGQDADGNYLPDDVGLDSPGFIASGEWIQKAVTMAIFRQRTIMLRQCALCRRRHSLHPEWPLALAEYRDAGVNFSVDPMPSGPTVPARLPGCARLCG